jgi:hypothetical protein
MPFPPTIRESVRFSIFPCFNLSAMDGPQRCIRQYFYLILFSASIPLNLQIPHRIHHRHQIFELYLKCICWMVYLIKFFQGDDSTNPKLPVSENCDGSSIQWPSYQIIGQMINFSQSAPFVRSRTKPPRYTSRQSAADLAAAPPNLRL